MKLAVINYVEDFADDNQQYNNSFVVEYTSDFDNKVEELERFQDIVDEYVYSYDDDENVITKEDAELIEKYFDGNVIGTITNYIYDNFNVVPIEKEIDETW